MRPDELLSALSYEQLVAQLLWLRDEIDAYQEMTPEDEREIRQSSSAGGRPLPEDFRSIFTVDAGMRQCDIVRECLRRVDLGRLAMDSGYPRTSLLLFASYRGDPPDPSAN